MFENYNQPTPSKTGNKAASWRGCLVSLVILLVASIIAGFIGSNSEAGITAGLAGVGVVVVAIIGLFFAMPAHQKLKSIGATFAVLALLCFGFIVLEIGGFGHQVPNFNPLPFFVIVGVVSAGIAAAGIWLGRRIAPKG